MIATTVILFIEGVGVGFLLGLWVEAHIQRQQKGPTLPNELAERLAKARKPLTPWQLQQAQAMRQEGT